MSDMKKNDAAILALRLVGGIGLTYGLFTVIDGRGIRAALALAAAVFLVGVPIARLYDAWGLLD